MRFMPELQYVCVIPVFFFFPSVFCPVISPFIQRPCNSVTREANTEREKKKKKRESCTVDCIPVGTRRVRGEYDNLGQGWVVLMRATPVASYPPLQPIVPCAAVSSLQPAC